MNKSRMPEDLKQFFANPTPIDYDTVPESIREWVRIEMELEGQRGLCDDSSFWCTGPNKARNSDGFEIESLGPYRLIVRSPEGEDLTIRCEHSFDGTDNVRVFYFTPGMTWDESDQKIDLEEILEIARVLDDAMLAFEIKAQFKLCKPSEPLEGENTVH